MTEDEEREIAIEAGAVFKAYSGGNREIVRSMLEPLEILYGSDALLLCVRHWCELARDRLPDLPWQIEIHNAETGERADPSDMAAQSPMATALIWATRVLGATLSGDKVMVDTLLWVVRAEDRVSWTLAALRISTSAVADYEGKVAAGMKIVHMVRCLKCEFEMPFADQGTRDVWAADHLRGVGHEPQCWPEMR